MHPLLARRSHLALYVVLWLIVGSLLAALFTAHGLHWPGAFIIALPLAVVYSFICLSAWYVSRGLPLTATAAVRVAASALAASVLSSAIWVAAGRAWIGMIGPRVGVGAGRAFADLGALVFGFGVLLYLLSLTVAYLIAISAASQEAQRRGLQGKVLAREAELRSLRAQIDPHFLFNSLNSISALTVADPPGARRMCLLLGDFLRETLALGGEQRIPLARELALADRFLAVERVRFGSRLAAQVSAGDAGACLVPALLLQPLVENAITHGIAHVLEGGLVRVAAERRGGQLRIVVENPCDADRPRRGNGGVGLANVRARLRALYESDATLTAAESGEVWRVEISLPAVEPGRVEVGQERA